MIERFLFYGVYTETAGTSVAGHNDLLVQILTDETEAALLVVQLAESGA